jgi:hypothetical protein
VCLFNRGADRIEGASAGIHFYDMEEPDCLDAQILLDLLSSPAAFLNEESQNPFSLKYRATLQLKEQPGGFCAWNNTKPLFRFILASKFFPEQLPSDIMEFANVVSTGWKGSLTTYKEWSQFDRNMTLSKALKFYELHTEFEPPLSLFLFALANQQGPCEHLSSFLLKKGVKIEHFYEKDLSGKNLFHYLSSIKNYHEIQSIAKKIKMNEPSCLSNLHSICDQGWTPLDTAYIKGKRELLFELKQDGAQHSGKFLSSLYNELCESSDFNKLAIIQRVTDLSKIDCNGKTLLYHAIEKKSNLLVEHILKDKEGVFFSAPLVKQELIQYALTRQNSQAAELIEKLYN